MREIEFRGKAYKTGAWVFGSLIVETYTDGDNAVRTKTYINVDPNVYPDYDTDNLNDLGEIYEVDPETVGQYTGKKDIQKTKIYEGDKIRNSEKIFEVVWRNCQFESLHSINMQTGKLIKISVGNVRGSVGGNTEVIGNIHERTE